MSETSVETSGATIDRDFFDSAGGAPSVSWAKAQVGTKIRGILAEPHRTTQQTTVATATEPAKPKFYKGPDGREDRSAPMLQAELTLQTEFRNFELTSAALRQRAAESGAKDDGLRRVFVRGSLKQASTHKAFKDALRAAGVQKPEVGAVIEFEVTKLTESPTGGADLKDFRASYTRPTPETIAKVTKPAEADDDGMFGGGDGSGDDEPPF